MGILKSLFSHKLKKTEQIIKNKWVYKNSINSDIEKIDPYLNGAENTICKLIYPRNTSPPIPLVGIELVSRTKKGLDETIRELGL